MLNRLIAKRFPAVHAHWQKHAFDIALVAQKWFIALFVDSVPIETVMRIWDAFFNEGNKVLFRVVLAMIRLNEAKILALRESSELYSYMKQMPDGMYDCQTLMTTAFTQVKPLRRATIDGLRREAAERIGREATASR